MSKICPNCKRVFEDDEFICGNCGVNLVNVPEKPNPTLNIGDANAVSGSVNINQSKSITSHDVHYHTVQERNKSVKELLQDRQNQYHDTVAKLLKGGVITVEARAQLDKLKFNLGLDDSIAAKIEATVKNEQKAQAHAGNDGLSVIGKMALKIAVAAVAENSPQVQNCIVKLAPVCKTTMNEQVHFYYSMLLAASDPQRCVETYEKRKIDSYWLSYWASVAYRKLGNEMEAEGILNRRKGEKDARQMIVSLTSKGKRLQKELRDVPATVGSTVLCKEVTPESVPGLFMALDGIIDQLSKSKLANP